MFTNFWIFESSNYLRLNEFSLSQKFILTNPKKTNEIKKLWIRRSNWIFIFASFINLQTSRIKEYLYDPSISYRLVRLSRYNTARNDSIHYGLFPRLHSTINLSNCIGKFLHAHLRAFVHLSYTRHGICRLRQTRKQTILRVAIVLFFSWDLCMFYVRSPTNDLSLLMYHLALRRFDLFPLK